MNFEEVVSDRSRFPDETKITLADGVEVKLGDIRAGYMKDADYRKKTSEVSSQRKELEQDKVKWEEARLDAEAKLADLARQMLQRNPSATPDDVDTYLETDPVAKRLKEKMDRTEQALAQSLEVIKRHEQALGAYAQTYVRDQHIKALNELKSQDPDLDQEALIRFAQERRIGNLYDAHAAYSWNNRKDSLVKKAKDEGLAEGLEKAKAELTHPVIRARRTMVGPEVDKEAPKSWEDAMDKALQDDEVMKSFQPGGDLY